MGRLSQLFNFKKPSPSASSNTLSLDTPIPKTAEPWQGNLPCVFGPSDGCNNHNPARRHIYFDPLLFPESAKIKSSGNLPDREAASSSYSILDVQSSLPRKQDSGCLTTLPRVHQSVPYTPAFYHVNAVMEQARKGIVPQLSRLACAATTGRNPPLSWVITPVIAGSSDEDISLCVEYALAFTVEADLGAWSEQAQIGRAVAKNALIGSGYRNFTPCKHVKISFRSHRGEGKNHVRYAGVSYSIKIDGRAEIKEEWRSEVDKEVEPVGCERCWTDAYMRFRMVGNVVIVSVQVYKDLGAGRHPADPKWLGHGRAGTEVVRGKEDFRRMRGYFVEEDKVNLVMPGLLRGKQPDGVEVDIAGDE